MYLKTFILFSLTSFAEAWVPAVMTGRASVALSGAMDRDEVVLSSRNHFVSTVMRRTLMSTIVASIIPKVAVAEDIVTLPSGVSYKIVKSGDGPTPDTGELAAIRFAAYCNDIKIDDIFETPEPYYTRVGSGGLLKGVEQVLPQMRVGDRWVLTIPGDLAFGSKGRPASAGKPRIPGGATIIFDVEMVGLPGKEPELIELIGDV